MRLFIIALILLAALPAAAEDSHAVIVMYHRFGDSRYPSTNSTIEQVKAHIAYLQKGGFHVLPLEEIVDALKDGGNLPDKAVAITVDDSYKTFYTHAWPHFREAKMPVTLFVATDDLDKKRRDFMSWDELRQAVKEGLYIGNHSVHHPHMSRLSGEEIEQEINGAQQRLQDELGIAPKLFAYPFGDYDERVKDAVKKSGFNAAFAQVSGVAYPANDFYAIPRFALNENYGKPSRFKELIDALPLPLKLEKREGQKITLRLTAALKDKITCYASPPGDKPLAIEAQNDVLVMTLPENMGAHARLNCTAPSGKRWRWWSMGL